MIAPLRAIGEGILSALKYLSISFFCLQMAQTCEMEYVLLLVKPYSHSFLLERKTLSADYFSMIRLISFIHSLTYSFL